MRSKRVMAPKPKKDTNPAAFFASQYLDLSAFENTASVNYQNQLGASAPERNTRTQGMEEEVAGSAQRELPENVIFPLDASYITPTR